MTVQKRGVQITLIGHAIYWGYSKYANFPKTDWTFLILRFTGTKHKDFVKNQKGIHECLTTDKTNLNQLHVNIPKRLICF